MSYVDEVLEKVVAKNPAEPEFHPGSKRSIGIIESGNRSKRGEIQKRRFA